MSKAKIVSSVVRVPAGEYWVGDPCYGVPDRMWMTLLESCDFFNNPIGTVNGVEVVAFGTDHGDGVYKDVQGREYGVDAGLIGLIPVGAFPAPAQGLMHKVAFGRPTNCSAEDGVITFGLISIDTAGDDWLGFSREDDDTDDDS